MCCHTPASWRKRTDAGVRELHRFEYFVGEEVSSLAFERSRPSTSAILRFEVMGEAPVAKWREYMH